MSVADRVLREFNRYTGDGLPDEPVNAPLPVGDPKSGTHIPTKKDFRDLANGLTVDGFGANLNLSVSVGAMAAASYDTGTNTLSLVLPNAALANATSAGLALLDDATPADQRTTLGLGNSATQDLAFQWEAEAGTDNTKIMTPLRTAQAISSKIGMQWREASTVSVTSGNAVEFTGLPTTATQFRFAIDLLSFSDGSDILFRFGTSGSYKDTGYRSYSNNNNYRVDAAHVVLSSSTYSFSGFIDFSAPEGPAGFPNWVSTHSGIRHSPSARDDVTGACRFAMNGPTTRILLFPSNSSATFTDGIIKLFYLEESQ